HQHSFIDKSVHLLINPYIGHQTPNRVYGIAHRIVSVRLTGRTQNVSERIRSDKFIPEPREPHQHDQMHSERLRTHQGRRKHTSTRLLINLYIY
ncbi:hypothetical protein, partial [Xenorhabdus bovienii]|uniref:hypothetical protein n=1 Tax=Xenorhabdus bovienii TaxID=40576 RepID=UPI00237C6835